MGGMAEPVCSSFSVTHIGLIVPDAELVARNYEKVFGLKPVTVWDTGVHTYTYRGKAVEGRLKGAFVPMGPISIELLQPVAGPSLWRDALDRGGGVQHIAFQVGDGGDRDEGAFVAAGMPVIQRGDYTGGCYRYVDTDKFLGVGVEFTANR